MKVKGNIHKIEKKDASYPDGGYNAWVELTMILSIHQPPFFKDTVKENNAHNDKINNLKLGECEVIQNVQ